MHSVAWYHLIYIVFYLDLVEFFIWLLCDKLETKRESQTAINNGSIQESRYITQVYFSRFSLNFLLLGITAEYPILLPLPWVEIKTLSPVSAVIVQIAYNSICPIQTFTFCLYHVGQHPIKCKTVNCRLHRVDSLQLSAEKLCRISFIKSIMGVAS